MEEINVLKTTVLKCHRKRFSIDDEECTQFCTKTLNHYSFPIEFFDKISKALKIIFERLTKNEIESYYSTIKGREYNYGNGNTQISFYDFDDELKAKYNFDQVKWEYKAEDGIAIFYDHMSKKYINSFASVLFVGFLSVILKILF